MAAKPSGNAGGGRARGGGGVRFAGPGVPLNSPILDPSKPLSGQSLYNAAAALANAQTKGPLAELANQIAQNNRQTSGAISQTGGYLNSLGNFAKQGVSDEQNIANSLNLGLGMIGQGEQQGLQGISQGAQQSLSQYAPQSGQGASTVSPAMQSLTQELARQQGLAAQQQGAFKSSGAVQGANYGSLAAQNLATDALAGTQTLKGIAQAGEVKNEPLNSKIAALNAQKGALIGTDLGRLRQQEIANRFTSQGLGLKSDSLKLTAAQDAARNSLTARGQHLTSAYDKARIDATIRGQDLSHMDRQDAIAARQAAANLRAGNGGQKPLTTAQNNRMLGVLGKIQNAISTFQQQGIKDKSGKVLTAHPTEAQIRSALMGIDPLGGVLIQAAYELLGYGSIDQREAAAMHASGIRGGTFRGSPIKVTANYNPNNIQQNPLSNAFTG